MTRAAYLTIDDSPSGASDDIIDFLHDRGINALIFCRGDMLEENSAPMRRAVEKGFILGNHLFSHRRASRLGLDTIKDEIIHTEALIDNVYKDAGVKRTMKTIRFPYLDRGMGSWFVEPRKIPEGCPSKTIYRDLIAYGLGHKSLTDPDFAQIDKKNLIQEYLAAEGYAAPEFPECSAWWFTENHDVASAYDTLITCSSSDWMLTERHKGRWQWKKPEQLIKRMLERMDEDEGAQIILMHDQTELKDVFKTYIEQLQEEGVEFLPIS